MTAALPQTARWPATGTPAIETAYPPDLRHDHDDLAAMARSMLESRIRRFPDLVAAGTMTQADADAEVALFRQIADHWIWVTTGEGSPAPRRTVIDRCEALDRSLHTIAEIAGMRGGFDAELAHQAHCVIALRWHAEPRREDRLNLGFEAHHRFRRTLSTTAKEPAPHV